MCEGYSAGAAQWELGAETEKMCLIHLKSKNTEHESGGNTKYSNA